MRAAGLGTAIRTLGQGVVARARALATSVPSSQSAPRTAMSAWGSAEEVDLEPVRAFDALLATGKSYALLAHATLKAETSRWPDLSRVGLELQLESLEVFISSEAAKRRRLLVVRVLCNGVLLQLVRDPVVEGSISLHCKARAPVLGP